MHFYNTTPLTLRKGDPQFPSIIYNSNSFLIRQGVRLGSASPPPDSRGPQLEYLIPEHFYWEEAEPSYHQLEARIAPTPATRPSQMLVVGAPPSATAAEIGETPAFIVQLDA